MTRVNSRAKGARGELQLAKTLTDLGYPASRGQQHRGGADSPDVVCLSLLIHWECKVYAQDQRSSPAMLTEWRAQAERDAGDGMLPVIAHRWLRSSWWCAPCIPGRPLMWYRLEDLLSDLQHLTFPKETAQGDTQ